MWRLRRPEPRPIETNANGQSVLTFYIKRKTKGEVGAINLHIISSGLTGRQTPIILDPRIKNQG